MRTDAADDPLPEVAWWVALSALPQMGPARMRALVAHGASTAWAAVRTGSAASLAGVAETLGAAGAPVLDAWTRAARGLDPAALWAAHAHLHVSHLGSAAHPARLADDVEPPLVVFGAGDVGLLSAAGPALAIVGTRRCSRSGADLAREVGRAAADAGVRVVSGLASGIDAAAHRGALEAQGAAPVGVVGSGLDVVYPERSRQLWSQVAEVGVLLSEHPLGTPPARWRFPARNRLVAALADAVLVVESGRRGGSMYTVDEALRRQRPVLAVPGSVRSAASEGTNWLLAQGATVACGPEDVLAALGVSPPPRRVRADPRPAPSADGRRVLRALGADALTLDGLAPRVELALPALAVALDELESDGWIARSAGRIERRGAP